MLALLEIITTISSWYLFIVRLDLAIYQYCADWVAYTSSLWNIYINTIYMPLKFEYSRFMTVFRPEPIVWYNWRCVVSFPRSLISKLGLSGQGSRPIFWNKEYSPLLEALTKYSTSATYRNQYCALYVTKFDICILLITIIGLVFCAYVCYASVIRYLHIDDPLGRALLSKYINYLISKTKQPFYDVATYRKIFSSAVGVTPKPTENHTHPLSAAIRTASSSTISMICASMGVEPYYLQLSKCDVRHNRKGARSYHWGKDLGVEANHFAPPDDSVIAIIDSDMYIDMPYLLGNYVHTYMISTVQPVAVSSESGEYNFTFDENDEMIYTVSGGATFKHKVWNYGGDVIVVNSRVNYGLCVQTTAYNIDRRQISEHHQIICLTPMKTFVSPIINLGYLLGGDALDRYHVSKGDFLRLSIKTAADTMVSTGRPNALACATITKAQDDTIAELSRLGKIDLSLAQVKNVIDNMNDEQAAILVAFHRKKITYSLDTVFPVEFSVKRYQFDRKTYDPDARPSMHAFMNPIINECYVPDKCLSNDKATIQGRVFDVKPPDDLVITEFDKQIMEEFVRLLVPDAIVGKGAPVDFDEVYIRQNRPTQVAILDKGGMSTKIGNDPIKCFQKAECYSDIKDPRNISTIPGDKKLLYSRFQYAFTDQVLKKQTWYAFAKTPLEIANCVAKICSAAANISNTDLSRFDGRVSKTLRLLESMFMQRWVRSEYKPILAELMASQQNQRAVTTFGVKFNTGFSRLSGSPETSSFNTIDNAYMAYKALRMTMINGMYMDPYEAWGKLGIYGGDDGITPDVDPVSYVRSCASVGQKLEIVQTLRGEFGVTFLSRYYSNTVWFGNPDSMCDVRRQIAKLHVTPTLPPNVTAFQKLHEKCTGYFFTDKNTPIIGEIASTVVALHGFRENKWRICNYFADHPEHEQFPNNNSDGWMEYVIQQQMPEFDWILFRSWILQVLHGTADVLSPPLCVPGPAQNKAVKRTVVVDGDITESADSVQDYGRCKHIVDKLCKFGDKCNHITKKMKCYGSKCKFQHGKVSKTPDTSSIMSESSSATTE